MNKNLQYPANVLNLFLTELKIPISVTTLTREVYKHPNNNTILGFSELMNGWKIANGAYNCSFEELMQSDLPFPYMVGVANNKFLVVKGFENNSFLVGDEINTHYKISLKDFEARFNNWVFTAQGDDESGDEEYRKNVINEFLSSLRLPFVVIGVLASMFLLLLKQNISVDNLNWEILAILALKVIGLYTTCLLILRFFGVESSLAKKICQIGKNDCNSILISEGAKITSWLSWSEVGFFYFAGTTLVSFFNVTNAGAFQVLSLLTIAALPYTFYSIFYQWKIAKNWCTLCCIVQAVLWGEFFLLIPFLKKPFNFRGFSLSLLIVELLIPVILWTFIRPYLMRSNKAGYLEGKLGALKFNLDLFNYMLSKEAPLKLLPDDKCIILGNKDAENTITVVTDPFCRPCAKAHQVISKIIYNKENVKVQIVFRFPSDRTSPKTVLVNNLLNLYTELPHEEFEIAYNAWCSGKKLDYSAWTKKFMTTTASKPSELLDIHDNWRKFYRITETPTVLFNSRKLPSHYDIDDIMYLF